VKEKNYKKKYFKIDDFVPCFPKTNLVLIAELLNPFSVISLGRVQLFLRACQPLLQLILSLRILAPSSLFMFYL
jgi:hypothetical protein